MLSKVIDHQQKNWDRCLPLVLMAYRSSRHETTGCSPNEMMFGREVILPNDLIMDTDFTVDNEEKTNQDTPYVLELKERLRELHKFARDRIEVAHTRQRLYYDRRTNDQHLIVGDEVLLYNPTKNKGLSPKLMRFWEGPRTVIDRLSDVTFRIKKKRTAERREWYTTIDW